MTKNPAPSARPVSVRRLILSASVVSLVAAVISLPSAGAQFISIGAPSTYLQDFNTLPTVAGNWANNSTLPGWYAVSGNFFPADTLLGTIPLAIYNTGGAKTSGFFSAGTGTERALAWGATTTGYGASAMGVVFQNTSANTLAVGNISFNGELYVAQSNANALDGLQFFYQIGNSATTNLAGTAVHTNGAAYAANAALDDTGWTRISGLEYFDSVATASQIQNPVKQKAISANAGLTLAPGQFITLRWRSFNESGTDATVGIDDLSVSFLAAPNNLIYNRSHTVGGAPDGVIQVGAGNYWLRSGTPVPLTTNDNVFFSQSGNTTLSVPANVSLSNINIPAGSGTYTFNGAGALSGALIKTNSAKVVFNNSNTFSSLTISDDGTLQATAPQTIAGPITVSFGSSGLTPTIQTDANITAGSLAGTELLTKTGAGALVLTGVGATSTATGGVLVKQGSLRTATAAALGQQNIALNGAGAALVFTHTAGDQTLNAATSITPGAAGAEISVESGAAGVGVVMGTADRLIGANTFTKTGNGILRMSANQGTFTGNWIINGGAVQYGNGFANALGSGTVTINAGGELAGQNTVVPVANITLNGGALGTRTGALTDFTGTVKVAANSEAHLRSVSTPSASVAFSISGLLTGAGDLTLTGNLPLTDSGGAADLKLKNTGNTFTGGFHVTQFQTLTSEPTAGSGSTLNHRPVLLSGGRLRVHDNGTADNGTITYGSNVTVDSGVASVDVDRQTAGTFISNTVQFGTLTMATGSTLASTGANGYQAHFGAATVTGTGDVTFRPTSAPLILAGGLAPGAFGVIKNGSGVFGITGNAAYTGHTVINEGTFGTNGQLTGTPRIDIKAGATLDTTLVAGGLNIGAGQTLAGTGTVNGSLLITNGGTIEGGNSFGVGTLSTGPLTFGSIAGETATIRAAAGNAGGSIFVSGTNTLVANGGANSVTVEIFGTQPTVGTHVLIDYTGVIGGTGFAAFKLGSMPPRTTATLVNNAGDSIALSVSAIDFPIWKGAASTEWSTATIAAPKNWVLNSNNASTTDFLTNDRVLFNDTAAVAAGNVNVAINGADVAPQEVIFDNKTKGYTLQGTNGITGLLGITKNGDNSATSTLTIENNHSFTGAVKINAGTIRVATIADGGVTSPLGAGTSLVFDGGALEFTGVTGSTNRLIDSQTNGATVKTGAGSALTLAGVIRGTGGFSKTGDGTLLLAAANTYTGVTTLAAGLVNVGVAETAGVSGPLGNAPAVSPGNLVFAGGTLQYSAANANDYSGRFSTDPAQSIKVDTNGRTVIWAGDLISIGGALTKSGAGQLVLAGAGANTYSGITTVNNGTLTLSKTSGINAIGGDLIVNAGGIVAYGTTAGQLQDHLADTAHIVVNGGTFGSGVGNTDDAPTQGVLDTVASVTVSSGKFLTGRYLSASPLPFTITGGLEMSGGTVLVQRGGSLSAHSVEIAGPAVLNMDGGSSTAGNQSHLTIGAGGLALFSGAINFNAGPSALAASSVGSILLLQGNVTSAGTSALNRLNPTVAVAVVDLASAVHTFSVTGILTVAADLGTAVDASSAGIVKTGAGKLVLDGAQSYASLTHNAGRTDVSKNIGTGTSTVTANAGEVNFGASQTLGSLIIGDGASVALVSPLPPAPGEAGPAFDAALAGVENASLSPAAVPEPGSAVLFLCGLAALLGKRRRAGKV